MHLDRVTVTGADDSISPNDLVSLTQEFPFVEWGILVSHSQGTIGQGSPRFPSARWITDIQSLAETTGIFNLSLHLCGRWVRDLLAKGEINWPDSLLHCFQRVQLNFHADKTPCEPKSFASALKKIGKQFIFQIDGAKGNEHLDAAHSEEVPACYGLFDISGGAGILPQEWPAPIYLDVSPGAHGEGVESYAYHGYAGGLGPENLDDQIPLIAKACAGARIWIDMETRVRSRDDLKFDLSKVRHCLEIAAPFVGVDFIASK